MGLRLREMLCLRWDRFDWDLSTVELLAAETKTRRGRCVPIPSDLLPEFAARQARALSPYVFPSRCGKSWQTANKTAWRRCRVRAGVMVRWHDLRHTCATLLLRRGIPPHVARVYLGMSEAVLTRIYLHLSIEDLRRAAEAMSGKIG
jgi:integrase